MTPPSTRGQDRSLPRSNIVPSFRAWICALASVLAGAGTAVAQGQDPDEAGQPLPEVTVTAERALDHRTLDHAVDGFVQSHSAPGARTDQIGRWWGEKVCPLVTGLKPEFDDLVAREVLNVARDAGVPVRPVGKKCAANVEIVFTPDPQGLLDHIAKSYRLLLGFYPTSQATDMKTFSRPIQAWYETGTRQTDCPPPTACLPVPQLDSDYRAATLTPSGVASHFKRGLRSEFLHVLIIADSGQLSRYSLQSIADYAAMLSLARMGQLGNCAPLRSITDLLASGCTTPAPESLTAADRAYLKALYSADLEKTLILERSDVHARMMQQIEGH